VIYTYNGILFGLKKKGKPIACYDIDESWGHYTKWKKINTVWSHLYEVFKEVNSHKHKVCGQLPGAEERSRWGIV